MLNSVTLTRRDWDDNFNVISFRGVDITPCLTNPSKDVRDHHKYRHEKMVFRFGTLGSRSPGFMISGCPVVLAPGAGLGYWAGHLEESFCGATDRTFVVRMDPYLWKLDTSDSIHPDIAAAAANVKPAPRIIVNPNDFWASFNGD